MDFLRFFLMTYIQFSGIVLFLVSVFAVSCNKMDFLKFFAATYLKLSGVVLLLVLVVVISYVFEEKEHQLPGLRSFFRRRLMHKAPLSEKDA